jgi:hypothetical protein
MFGWWGRVYMCGLVCLLCMCMWEGVNMLGARLGRVVVNKVVLSRALGHH